MEAVIKTTTIENGETVVDEKVISGTEEEIQAAVEEMKDVKISIKRRIKVIFVQIKSGSVDPLFLY